MQSIISRLRRSASIKVVTIGFLVLVLLIPLGMVRSTIIDRDQVNRGAIQDIQRTWGRPQLIAGPVLVLPYDNVHVTERGELFVDRSALYVLPSDLAIDASVASEVRYRGIYKVPVYTSTMRLSGRFDGIDADALGIDDTRIHWNDATIAVGISDARAISATPSIEVDGASVLFAAGGAEVPGLPPQIVAPAGQALAGDRGSGLQFTMGISVKGSESLRFLPLGDTTQVTARSPWPSPSFSGAYLPESREITADGFSAEWRISSIGRALPSRWSKGSAAADSAGVSAFGVDLYMPVSIYQLTLRAATYGILFIGLTFVSYFMFEVIAGLTLHPLQYLLVGLANVIFFLLLISLSEHIGFGAAYLLSALGSSGLIVGYSHNVLGDRTRTAAIGGILLLLYSFLYMTLQAESYALLAGALGLWTTLGLIMYLTRRIDWYAQSSFDDREDDDRQHDLLGI